MFDVAEDIFTRLTFINGLFLVIGALLFAIGEFLIHYKCPETKPCGRYEILLLIIVIACIYLSVPT